MSFDLTLATIQAAAGTNIEPQIVLEIEGYEKIYGALPVLKYIRYGDEDLFYGGGENYGGLNEVENQSALISFTAGTTTQITQQLNVDKGTGESISSFRVALVDKDGEVTLDLLTPDETLVPPKDIMGRRARVWLGFNQTAWKDDYIVVFRGVIDLAESKPGLVLLQINAPDTKKKTTIFTPWETETSGAINNSVTSIAVADASGFFTPGFLGPSGVADSNLEFIVRIDDELIRVGSISSNNLNGCTRGYLNTIAASHDDQAQVSNVIRIQGNAMDLALKLMLGGRGGFFQEDVAVSNFNQISLTETLSNTIVFKDIDIESEYNIQVGDYITTTGAANGANNVSLKEIIGIGQNDFGSHLIIDGVTFVTELGTSATVSFRSQYDVWNVGLGAAMHNDEVDIAEHLRIKTLFLPETSHYDFRFTEEIDLKEFLSEQIYNPVSCYSVPRKAQASVGIHIQGLIPGGNIPVLNNTNVTQPQAISINRSTAKNFFNAAVYKYEEDPLEPDRFLKVYAATDVDSTARIKVGTKPLVIESKGMRNDLGGDNIADTSTTRRLNKYKYAAEYLKNVKPNFKTGFNIEIGDVVNFDMSTLKVSDIKSGTRNGSPRLFEVTNRTLDIRSGQTNLELTDTNFSQDVRYCLISPYSNVSGGLSQTEVLISQTNIHPFGVNEFRMWESYIGAGIRVRSLDFVTFGNSTLIAIDGNRMVLDTPLGFTPAAGMIFELSDYDSQPESVKLVYGFMQDNATFADGKQQYQML